jgi:hypothetical protein
MKRTGNLEITAQNAHKYTELVEVTGYLSINSNAKLDALTSVGGSMYIYSDAKLDALTSVGGYLYIYSDAKLDALTSVGGYLSINSNAKLDAPNLTSVGGYLYINSNAKLEAPFLTSVGGYLSINSNAKLDAPFLKSVNWMPVDSILFVIESKRTTKGIEILKGYNLAGVNNGVHVKEQCFVARKGDYTAHGETAKEAVRDLNYKIIAEKLKHDPILPDTIITPEYYHIVTGSCKAGIASWLQSNNIAVTEITAKELLPILEERQAYGLESFKRLINW